MAYLQPLRESAAWLLRHQGEDGGWGLAPGQASSLVNTAEALLVLAKAKSPSSAACKSINYLRTSIEPHLALRGNRTRYLAFPLLVLGDAYAEEAADLLPHLAERLVRARNRDDGWGFTANDQRSDLFSTYLATEALRQLADHADEVAAAGRWALAQGSGAGWPLHERHPTSLTATAYAIQILTYANLSDSDAYQHGRELLLAADTFDNEDAVVDGSSWVHCRAAAILRALTLSGTDPFHPAIAECVRFFNRRMIPGEGWGESPLANMPTVRAQFWAVHALALAHDGFDNAVHIPRVSAERAQGVLVEPHYLPFLTGTQFHFILPAPVFRIVVYALTMAGALLITGVAYDAPPVPIAWSVGIGIIVLGFVALLVRKRPKQFPRSTRWLGAAIAGLAFVDLAFGWSISQLLAGARALVGRGIDWIG